MAERGVSSAWPAVAVLTLVSVVSMNAVGLQLERRGALVVLFVCAVLETTACFYRFVRPDLRLASALTLTAQLLVYMAAGACLSYAAGATNAPLWDATLMRWDEAIGLDWRAYLAFVDGWPWVGTCFAVAYRSLLPQSIVVVLLLGLTGRSQDGRRFVEASVIAILATCLIFHLMPALGIFAHLGLAATDFAHIDPVPAYGHLPTIGMLRDGTFRVIAFDRIEGIIPFPSFHAALAVLYARALWTVPWARWPAVLLNVAVIASTPIEGGHYFVDVLGGIVVALAADAVARFGRARTNPDPGRVFPGPARPEAIMR